MQALDAASWARALQLWVGWLLCTLGKPSSSAEVSLPPSLIVSEVSAEEFGESTRV